MRSLIALCVTALVACGDDDEPTDGLVDGGEADPLDAGSPDAAAPAPDAGSAFLAACTPEVVFENRDADGDGAVFTEHVADPVALVQATALRVCELLYDTPDEVPARPSVKLVIEAMEGVAYAAGGEVHFSSGYIAGIGGDADDVEYEIIGVLVHEYTHVYQYNDGPGWLIEGIADFVRYRAGFVPERNRGPGGNYDDAYQTTAFFLDWVDLEHPGFGKALNRALDPTDGVGFSLDVFETLAGDDVEALWEAYQATFLPALGPI
jgi:hypothetical protein